MLVDEDLSPLGFDHQGKSVESLELAFERATGHQLDGEALADLETLKKKTVLNIDRVLRYAWLARPARAPSRSSKTRDMSSRSVECSHVMPLSFRNQVSCRLA